MALLYSLSMYHLRFWTEPSCWWDGRPKGCLVAYLDERRFIGYGVYVSLVWQVYLLYYYPMCLCALCLYGL